VQKVDRNYKKREKEQNIDKISKVDISKIKINRKQRKIFTKDSKKLKIRKK
jgi:hypothetical protein